MTDLHPEPAGGDGQDWGGHDIPGGEEAVARAGVEDLMAVSGISEALAQVQEKDFHPDVAFLDIEMPEENGFALAAYIWSLINYRKKAFNKYIS